MFGKKSVILDDYVQNNLTDCVANDKYFDNISINDLCYERNLIDHKMKAEAHTVNLNSEIDDSSPYIKLNGLDMYNGRRNGIYERNRKNKFDDETFMDILTKNGIKFDSKQELTRVLAKIRSKYSWSHGFSLQLGSKGRKIMLQLLRLAYKSNKKNKNIFQNKNPPTTISNLPFFKISMLWELAKDMGVFEHAILIHELFGSFKKKLITPENTSFYYPDTAPEKYKFKNNLYRKSQNMNGDTAERRTSENLDVEPKHGEINNATFCMSPSGDFVKIRDQMCQEDSINILNSIINDVVMTQDHATVNPPYSTKAVGLMHQNKHHYPLVSQDESNNFIKINAFEPFNHGVPVANLGMGNSQRSFRGNEMSSHIDYAPAAQNFIFNDNKFRGSPSSVSTCVSTFLEDALNDHKLLHSTSPFDICSPTKGSYSDLSDLNGYMKMDNELTNYDSIFLDNMVNVDHFESEAMDSYSSYLNAN